MGVIAERKSYWERTILTQLQVFKTIKITDVARLLDVSDSTARRFLKEMDDKGLIIRSSGMIKLQTTVPMGNFFISRQLNQKQAKEEIAEYAAANTVENGDTIFLGNGTTVQYFSIALAKQLATGKLRNIQIFTNSFTNVSLLHPYSDIMLIGGQYRNNWQDFIGYLTDHLLKSISFKKCFIGTDGIHLDDGGIYAEDMATARIDELVLRRNEKSFLLADSTKLNRRSLIRYGSIQDIYMIITDSTASDADIEALQANGAHVHKV